MVSTQKLLARYREEMRTAKEYKKEGYTKQGNQELEHAKFFKHEALKQGKGWHGETHYHSLARLTGYSGKPRHDAYKKGFRTYSKISMFQNQYIPYKEYLKRIPSTIYWQDANPNLVVEGEGKALGQYKQINSDGTIQTLFWHGTEEKKAIKKLEKIVEKNENKKRL